MKVFVTNDDSINSDGLWAAVQALVGVAEVVVAAPDRDQSGVGTRRGESRTGWHDFPQRVAQGAFQLRRTGPV